MHVFEERYRALVRDALEGPRLVGMVLLRAGWEETYYGSPPVYAVGTAGEIVRADPLDDGRWNIVLRGEREFVIDSEIVPEGAYRIANVRWADPPAEPVTREIGMTIWALARDLLARLGSGGSLPAEPDPSTDSRLLVNLLSQQLPLPVVERQAVLEAADGAPRAQRLITVLELQIEGQRGGGSGPSALQ